MCYVRIDTSMEKKNSKPRPQNRILVLLKAQQIYDIMLCMVCCLAVIIIILNLIWVVRVNTFAS